MPFGLLLLLWAASAHASEKPALHWVRGAGAEGCIDPRSLARAVEDITGPALVTAVQADLSIEARIEATSPRSYAVHMRLVSSSAAQGGERIVRFDTTDCRSLDGSIAFLIATAIDPKLGAEGLPKELSWVDDDHPLSSAESLRRDLTTQSSSKPAAPATLAPPDAPAATPERQPDPRQPPAYTAPLWQLGAAAMGGNGPSARLSAGLMLELSRTLMPRLTIAAQLTGETALSSRELGGGRSVIAQRFAVAVLACMQLPLSALFELRGCAGPELAGVLAHGSGFRSNKSTLVGGGGGLVRVDVLREIGDVWKLSAGLLLHAALGRPRITYEGTDSSFEAFRVVPWQLQAALGVAYRF